MGPGCGGHLAGRRNVGCPLHFSAHQDCVLFRRLKFGRWYIDHGAPESGADRERFAAKSRELLELVQKKRQRRNDDLENEIRIARARRAGSWHTN